MTTVSDWSEEDLRNAMDAHFRCQEESTRRSLPTGPRQKRTGRCDNPNPWPCLRPARPQRQSPDRLPGLLHPGNTPTPTSPSGSKPRPNTRSCSR